MPESGAETCELCGQAGGRLVWRGNLCRVVLVDDGGETGYTGYCRVIWNAHAAEMTDLTPQQRQHIMDVVWEVELCLREILQPYKINLASLGNRTPHVHWHVIPRYRDDAHFPDALWAASRRPARPAQDQDEARLLATLVERLSRLA